MNVTPRATRHRRTPGSPTLCPEQSNNYSPNIPVKSSSKLKVKQQIVSSEGFTLGPAAGRTTGCRGSSQYKGDPGTIPPPILH